MARPDVWIVNKKGRMVQVSAEVADAHLDKRAMRGSRLATEREIALYHDRRQRHAKNAADTTTMRDKVDALRESAEASEPVDSQPGEIDGITYAEAELALKGYDTKAKLIALAAEHGVEGLTDRMTLAELRNAAISAVMDAKIPFESL